nr:IS982 family transposase [Alphaproteobacteria bacterium]
KGQLMSFKLTPGNVDDRATVTEMVKNLKGLLFGDRGYISQKLSNSLKEMGMELVTKVKRNMKEKFIEPIKKYYLEKRGIIETIIDQLKNLLHIDHTRHRSVMNFQINVLGGLVAYIFRPQKVSVPFHELNKIEGMGLALIPN